MASLEGIVLAQRHVDSGRAIIKRQNDLIARLSEQQLSTVTAINLLGSFERTQAIFEDDLAALLKL